MEYSFILAVLVSDIIHQDTSDFSERLIFRLLVSTSKRSANDIDGSVLVGN